MVDGTDLTNYLLDNHNSDIIVYRVGIHHHHHHHHHLSLNREGRWGTKDDFTTNFLHFSLFSIALSDLVDLGSVHSLLMLSPHLLVYLSYLLPPFTVPCKVVLARPDECVSLRWSEGLRVVRLPAGSMRCIIFCDNTSFPWLVFFLGVLCCEGP